MHPRSRTLLAAVVAAALVIAGLAVPGVLGGVLLLLVAVALFGLTRVVRTQEGLSFDTRSWALRALVVMVLAAIGILKITGH